jgi:hypothetical protein
MGGKSTPTNVLFYTVLLIGKHFRISSPKRQVYGNC